MAANCDKILTFFSNRRGRCMTAALPIQCIAYIISFTSPQDACRSSLVCHDFRSAADSDAVWERFLPSDYLESISNMASSSELPFKSIKELYFHLCDKPILHGSRMIVMRQKRSGKKCCMVRAREFSPHQMENWTWTPLEVGERVSLALGRLNDLRSVWLSGNFPTKVLSLKTTYVAYLVYKIDAASHYDLDIVPVEVSVKFEGREDGERRHRVLLDHPDHRMPQATQVRGDGWMEIAMGQFFNEYGDANMVCELQLMHDLYSSYFYGLIVEGIELRPKVYG